MSDFLGYLHDVSDGALQADIARVAHVGQATVSRWVNVRPSAEAMAHIARHYHRPIGEVMIAAGYLDTDEPAAGGHRAPLREYTHSALLRELERRLDAQTSDPRGTITSPADYGKEPVPDDYDLAAGDVTRDPAAD